MSRARTRHTAAPLLAAAALTATLAAGCGGGSEPGPGAGTGTASGGTLHGTVVVFAAASLTEPFTTLAHRFEAAHPGVTVRLSFGGSDTLAAQITQNAPVDVFAPASPTTMATVTDAGDAAGQPVVFATNRLEVAVPPDNPAHVASLADTARPGLKLALCAPEVPCGAAARAAYAKAHLTPHPVTLEEDVKAVLTKVRLGEVDAGLVYRTDVAAAGSAVRGIGLPASAQVTVRYPVTVVRTGRNAAAGRAFVAAVLSADGRRLLTGAGFGHP